MLRKAVVALGPLFLGLTALLACEDDSASGGSTDAGTVDVSLTTPTLDGSPIPYTDDATTSPAAVTVTVTGVLGPVAGVPVVFHDATGAVLETLVTGADGKIASTKPGVAQVTAFTSRDIRRHAITWTNVSAGDQLRTQDIPPTGVLGTYDVSFATFSGGAGYTAYTGSCSAPAAATAGPPMAALDLTAGCIGPAPTAILMGASFRLAPRFAFTTTGPAAPLDGGAAAVTVPGNWAAASTTTLALANGSDSTTLSASLAPIADGLLFSGAAASTTITTGSVDLTYPTGFGDALQASLVANDTSTTRSLTKRFAAAATIDFDYVTMLGPLGAASVDATTPTKPTVTWTGDTAQTDGGLVNLAFLHDGTAYTWTFVVPAGTTTVTAPSLPVEHAAFTPGADAGAITYLAAVEFIEADMFDAASFRQTNGAVIAPWLSPYATTAIPALPATGTFRSTARTQSRRQTN